MTILLIIAAVIVLALIAVLALAAMKPAVFRIQRSMRINAPPRKIFDLVADFHRFGSWSPFEKLDPAMKRTFSGAPSGKGAVYEWEGNSKAGQGRMEITDVAEPSRVTIKLDFIKPFKTSNVTEFTMEPDGEATHVTWSMTGPNPLMFRVMTLFCDLDKMVGKDFEAGLANMKNVTESEC